MSRNESGGVKLAERDAQADTEQRLPVAGAAETRRAVARIFAADKGRATLVLSMYTLAAVFSVALPILLGEVVDGIAAGWSLAEINAVCALIVGCVAVQFVFGRLGRLGGYRFGERAAARLREGVVERVLTLPLGRVERAGKGDLGTRTATDVNAVADMLRDQGPTVATALIEVVVLYIATFVVDPVLGLWALTTIPLLAMVTRRYLRRARPAFLEQRAAMSETAETLGASNMGARTVAGFAMQDERREAGYGRADTVYTKMIRLIKLQLEFFPLLLMINRFQLMIVVLVSGLWYFDGGLTLGTAVAAITVTVRIANPTNAVMTRLTEFQQGGAALARIEGVNLVTTTERDADPDGSDIRLDAVTFGYGDGPDVLHGLSLHPRVGERLVVVGPSGAGKSTIARLLAGIDRPRTGTAHLGGVPVADIGIERLRQSIVLVTQEHYVFAATLRENLDLAAPDADDAALLAALEQVDARWAASLPDGLDTMLGDEHHALSIAEAQQLALARVVLADPDIVILDEATAGIDPASAGNVEAALAAALGGRTVIAIAHQLQAAQAADRIAVVEAGRIVETGPHDELLAAGGVYADLWHAWKGA
ncbi:ABC transporter ATP-binding protein [Glycomyces buryatensis]|uniref:ABC transporter ATP-binding protein n=1 Tax=Glycomyces buryatensis TaxID=2570927 RepID=A0A4S8PXE6_9ACTN|nr:ABC transporter ATP-binding protein [Glycomyces buryatensis]THV32909.1 ABC transporter ATP-binding protein [Glycomyces buryatensis]